jgi:hypothetical protein
MLPIGKHRHKTAIQASGQFGLPHDAAVAPGDGSDTAFEAEQEDVVRVHSFDPSHHYNMPPWRAAITKGQRFWKVNAEKLKC